MEHLNDNTNELVITSEHPELLAPRNGDISRRPDLASNRQDFDVIIVNHLVKPADTGSSNIRVICDDTDFILLIYFYRKAKLSRDVMMMSPVAGPSVIDIKATLIKHKDITVSLPGIHAISSCDK